MKKLFYTLIVPLVMLTACNTFGTTPQTDTTELWPAGEMMEDGYVLYGYINRSGKMVIKPQFQHAETFSSGYALVSDEHYDDFYINTSGKKLSFKGNGSLFPFYYNFALYNENLKYYYINTDFDYAFETTDDIRFDYCTMPKEGLIPYQRRFNNGRKVYSYMRANHSSKKLEINTKDTIVFAQAKEFIDGYADVKSNNDTEDCWGIINTNLEYTLQPKNCELRNIGNGLFEKTTTDSRQLIDYNGNVIIDDVSNYTILSFLEGEDMTTFHNSITGKYGFMDAKGNIAIQPQYDFTLNFSEGYTVVGNNDEYLKLIDEHNNCVFTFDKDEDIEMLYVHNGLLLTNTFINDEDGSYMLYRYRDTKGNVVYSWKDDNFPVLPCAPRRPQNSRPIKQISLGC
mgnify:CR=1 FL=1